MLSIYETKSDPRELTVCVCSFKYKQSSMFACFQCDVILFDVVGVLSCCCKSCKILLTHLVACSNEITHTRRYNFYFHWTGVFVFYLSEIPFLYWYYSIYSSHWAGIIYQPTIFHLWWGNFETENRKCVSE